MLTMALCAPVFNNMLVLFLILTAYVQYKLHRVLLLLHMAGLGT
jgi:hypothetical protein